MRVAFLIPPLVAFAATGCVSSFLHSDEKSVGYAVPSPGAGWRPIDPAEADAAYRHDADAAVFTVNSQCGDDRYAPLEQEARELLSQLGRASVTGGERPSTIDGLPALSLDARGTVDGRPVDVRITVVRSATCLYDFLLAGETLEPATRAAYDRVVAGFRAPEAVAH